MDRWAAIALVVLVCVLAAVLAMRALHGAAPDTRTVRGGGAARDSSAEVLLGAVERALQFAGPSPIAPRGGAARRARVSRAGTSPVGCQARASAETWTDLAADPAAWADHMADCEAIWKAQLDWSAVHVALRPKIAEGLYEYGGLIDCEPGPGPWRLKIIRLEHGTRAPPGGTPGSPPESTYAARPALFIFLCVPDLPGYQPKPMPSASRFASSIVDTLAAGFAARVVLSSCGAVIYGPDTHFRKFILGPDWALRPTPEQTYAILGHALDTFAAVSATASRAEMSVSEFTEYMRGFLVRLDFDPSRTGDPLVCWGGAEPQRMKSTGTSPWRSTGRRRGLSGRWDNG